MTTLRPPVFWSFFFSPAGAVLQCTTCALNTHYAWLIFRSCDRSPSWESWTVHTHTSFSANTILFEFDITRVMRYYIISIDYCYSRSFPPVSVSEWIRTERTRRKVKNLKIVKGFRTKRCKLSIRGTEFVGRHHFIWYYHVWCTSEVRFSDNLERYCRGTGLAATVCTKLTVFLLLLRSMVW